MKIKIDNTKYILESDQIFSGSHERVHKTYPRTAGTDLELVEAMDNFNNYIRQLY